MSLGTNDLSKAMEVAGAGLVTYGNDINDMISLVTAGTEIMVGRSQQVARGLNMIASRIVKNEDALEEYGISIYDTNGSLRSTYDILADLAPKWQTMGDAQRVALGDTLAGTNQYKVLAAVMGNFDSALKAHEIALNSAGSASRENERAIDSLAGHLNQLKAQFEALANNIVSSQFIKSMLDAGTAILKFANSDLGQVIIKVAAFGGALKGIGVLLPKILSPELLTWGSQFVQIIKATGLSVNGLQFAILGLSEALLANPLFGVAASGLLIFGLFEIIANCTDKFSDFKSAIEETNNAISETESEYNQLSSKPVEDLTTAERERLKVLEQQLQILKQQKLEQEREAYAAMPSSYVGETATDGITFGGTFGGVDANVNENIQSVQEYIKTLDTLNGVEADVRQSLADTAEQLIEFKDAGVELNEADQEFLETYELLIDANNLATESFETYGNVVGENVTQAMDALTSAIRVQNEQGYINEDIKNNLLALYPQLTDQITQQGNGYIINTNALDDLINAENIEQISINQSKKAAIDYINTLGGEKLAYSATIDAIKKAIVARLQDAKARMAAGAIDAATYNKLGKAQKEEYLAGQAVRAAASSEYSRLQGILSSFNASVNANTYALQGNTGAVNNNTGSVANSGGATQKATKATNSNTKATKANTDAQEKAKKAHDALVKALKSEADAYKTAAKYMSSQIEKQIDVLEKRKDAIEESYDAQIKAIQDANDAIEEQMELEKAQQALEEAKKKRKFVLTGGQFQYVEDTQAIAEAQENLNNIVRQQEMEQQVQNLENARDAEIKAIDDQIAGWEKYKEQWDSLADSYEEAQDKLIAQQVLGIKLEGDNWQKRLTNAQAFVDQYKKIMAQLDVLEGSETSTPKSAQTVLNQAKTLGTKGFVNGTTSTPAGIYKVGEAGTELMVGRGNGVIPHNLTENLMKLGQFSPSEWVNSIKGTFADKAQTVVQQFGDISLPNVSNASQFVEQLKQFKNYAVQATSRR